MKKITIYIAMALLCLNFTAKAQVNKAIDVTLKGIQIGQKVPDITISNLHNYKDANGKPATTAKLSDFKGKLLILDFWATWCSPCIAMIPKMDSLQKQFGDKIQFLSVTYQTEKEVLPFLEKLENQQKKHYDLPVVTDSKELHKLFPHTTLPHYVWLDGNGVVKAITEPFYINSKNISEILQTGNVAAKIKNEKPIIYNKSKSLFFIPNDISNQILKQTSWAGYIEGIGRSFHRGISSTNTNQIQRISARNLTIPELLNGAYLKELKETVFEVKDTSRFFFKTPIAADYMNWLRNGNAYCYELILDKSLAQNGSKLMQQDLINYFPAYSVGLEKRIVKCLTLVRTSNVDKIKSLGGKPEASFDRFKASVTNCYLNVLIARMQFYLQGHPLPLADETGYLGKTDLIINASLSNINELNKELQKYDLKFVEKESIIEMLVVRDSKP